MATRAKLLTEKEIRYAMEITNSVAQAATFLRINVLSFKKYASMFVDAETGKTLYEIQSNRRGTNISKRNGVPTAHKQTSNRKYFIEVLQGKHPDYATRNMTVSKLVAFGFKAEKCECCGFSEHRGSDGEIPLVVIFKDNDKRNFLIENIAILCHNCSFLQYGYYKHVPATYNNDAFSFLDEKTVDPDALVSDADDLNENEFTFTQADIDAVKRDI